MKRTRGTRKKFALIIESILNDPKKKRGAVLLALAAIVLLYAAIPSARCKHEWQPATCAAPQTCVKCGKTKGAPLKHQWEDTDAASVKICAVCGKVKGLSSDVGDDPLSGFWIWTGVGDTDSGKIYPVDESMIILFESKTGTVFLDDSMIDFTYSISSVDEDSICYALKADSGGSLLVVYGYGTDLPSALYHKLVMITDEGSVAVFSKYDP